MAQVQVNQRRRAGGGDPQGGEAAQDMTVRGRRELQREETRAGRYFEPSVDIYETEEALTVIADVPGAASEDIEVDLRENVLTITARTQELAERWKPIYREYRSGNYLRQFRLGQQIDQARITARVSDGVLTLTLPKVESALPRRIEVATS